MSQRSGEPSQNAIQIRGARQHNLKEMSLDIPRGQLVVVTGVSGSGKSTLAFDLLFAEGQRRFLDAMNAYARQFVEQMPRPDVDLIAGIPPTVSIEQRTSRGGGKSTVATVTEIHHFFRLLFARAGVAYCPRCQVPVVPQTRDQIGRQLRTETRRRGDLLLLAPVVRNRKGFHSDVATWAGRQGFAELRADGKIYSTRETFRLDRFREHDVEVVVGVLDRAKRPGAGATGQSLVDRALQVGGGTLFALDNEGTTTVHSTERACPRCAESFEPLDPKDFSYNSARGWCPRCRGFGELFYLPDVDRGARADAVEESWFGWQEGKREICPDCQGSRLKPIARAVRLPFPLPHAGTGARAKKGLSAPIGVTMVDLANLPVDVAFRSFQELRVQGREARVARDIIPEIRERLRFLNAVGLGYLQLGRGVTTLSGGEAQRIRLSAQLGSNLSGVLYVLDEPTIGLHPRDNDRLLHTLKALKARGNSLVVVEHDEATMREADYIIDLGPGAGIHGGRVVAAGTLTQLLRHDDSITGQCLRAQTGASTQRTRRPVILPDVSSQARRQPRRHAVTVDLPSDAQSTPALTLRDACVNNLKHLEVRFPLGRLTVVTGVSGSGKSSLVRECLLPALNQRLDRAKATPGAASLEGADGIQGVYEVDQSPIGRTPRSIPATYVGFFDTIRQLFAQVPEARLRGYTASRFSFNSAQGRCPDCEGAGVTKLEMNFLPPAFVTCESCQGTRFSRETLDIQYGGKNIAEVLALGVGEALDFFQAIPALRKSLLALHETGLDYLKLGQPSPTLSGGEAQRVKLVSHLLSGLSPNHSPRLAKRHHVFILEEPTVGLHIADVRRLLEVLHRLVDNGHTVIVIEHNLDLIADADWVIDLGPEGGDGGGQVVATGTPDQIAACEKSHTGEFLRRQVRTGRKARSPKVKASQG